MSRYTNLVIRASAGTGKTFQLSNRYIGLLNSGAPADRILASTFTRKAAGEILDRVILRLAEASLDSSKAGEMADFLDSNSLTIQRCRDLLERLTRSLHRLRVGTLDSFFSQLASSFSLELGLPPGWRIVEELTDQQLRSEAIELMLQDDSGWEVSRLMHLMTKGEAQRSISDLVRSTVNSLYGLFLETNAEAWHRFPSLEPLSDAVLQAAIDELLEVGLPEDKRFVAARQSDHQNAALRDWEAFIERGIAAKVAAGEETYCRKEIPAEVLSVYGKLVGHARAELISRLATQTAATRELLDRFHRIYDQLKFKARAMRFDDVTRRLSAGQGWSDVSEVEFRLDAEIAHLLLDEFQDTSLSQWDAIRPFAERVTHTAGQQRFFWEGGQQSFFCVGDVKQAIYGWRGGKSEIFDAIEANLSGLTQHALTTSFRSAPPVIDAVNRIFKGIPNHPNLADLEPAVARWCRPFPPHSTAKNEIGGYVSLETSSRAESWPEQAGETIRFAARKIAEFAMQSTGHQIGVLVRRNAVVAQLIFELRRLGVQASEEGGNPLTDSVAVQVVLSLMRMVDHPGDLISRMHVAASPLGPPLKFTDHTDEDAASRVIHGIRRKLLEDGYGATFHELARVMAPACNRRDSSRLQQLVEMAFNFQPLATLRTRDFVRHAESQRVADPMAAPVRVMTVHQAKGLQFDTVFLPELDFDLVGQRASCVVGQPDPTSPIDRVCMYRNANVQRLLPPDMQRMFEDATSQSVAETLCVLYVAVTRAVHSMHMIIPPSSTNEKNLHKTAAGLLRAALTDGQPVQPETVVWEHGQRDWFERAATVAKATTAAMTTAAARVPGESQHESVERPDPLPVRLAPMTDGRRRDLRRTAPSGLEGGASVKMASVLRLDNSAALARGTLIHAWFEQIRWLDDGRPDPSTLRKVAEQMDAAGLDVDEMLMQFDRMLDAPATSGALSRRAYEHPDPDLQRVLPGPVFSARMRLEVQNERRFAIRESNQLLSGTIDRLVLVYDQDQLVAAEVIDFKTDAVNRDDSSGLEETVEHYRPQLKAYRSAVAKMFRLDPQRISTRLLLLGADVVKSV